MCKECELDSNRETETELSLEDSKESEKKRVSVETTIRDENEWVCMTTT